MQTSSPHSRHLRDYTSIPFEIFIVAFTLLPFLVLAYFYSAIPERVPLYLTLSGEVSTWAQGHYMLGLSAWKSGDLDRAEAAFVRSLELDRSKSKSSKRNSRKNMLDSASVCGTGSAWPPHSR